MDIALFENGADTNLSLRHLQNNYGEQGRSILTILYLVVLSLCFVLPVYYYFRLQCADRRRTLRQEEVQVAEGLRVSVEEQSQGETRAARRKYKEEKRARIIQLFGPVSMVRSLLVLVRLRRVHCSQQSRVSLERFSEKNTFEMEEMIKTSTQ